MQRKIIAVLTIAIMLTSAFVILAKVQPASASQWITINDDPNLNGTGTLRSHVTWPHETLQNLDTEIGSYWNGVALTQESSTAGFSDESDPTQSLWDCSAFAFDTSVAATATQRINFRVNAYNEWMDSGSGDSSFFDVFTEFWVTFPEPTGIYGYQTAELMYMHHMVLNGDATPPATSENPWKLTHTGWYSILYVEDDIGSDTWTDRSCDVNFLLDKLVTEWGVNLSLGTVTIATFGVEGTSDGGGIAAAWDYYQYQVLDARTVTIASASNGYTDPLPGTYTTTGNPHITAYPDANYFVSGWQISDGTNTWTDSPNSYPNENEYDVTTNGARVTPIFDHIETSPTPTPTPTPTPSPTPTPPPSGATLTVQAYEYPDTPTSVEAYIDSSDAGATEVTAYPLDAGYHTIAVPDYDGNNWNIFYTYFDGDYLCSGQPGTIYVPEGTHTITFYYITGR